MQMYSLLNINLRKKKKRLWKLTEMGSLLRSTTASLNGFGQLSEPL